jgi:hypothetical protein
MGQGPRTRQRHGTPSATHTGGTYRISEGGRYERRKLKAAKIILRSGAERLPVMGHRLDLVTRGAFSGTRNESPPDREKIDNVGVVFSVNRCVARNDTRMMLRLRRPRDAS